jgi:hypothetical protein
MSARVASLEGSSGENDYIGLSAIGVCAVKNTYTLQAKNLLDDGYAIRNGLSASCTGPGQDVLALQCQWNGLGLDKGWAGKAHVSERTEDSCI